MKYAFLVVILVIVGVSATYSLAVPPQPVSQDFIRPYRPPKEVASAADALADFYKQNGAKSYEFEYSLPARTELMVKIIFSKNGVIDRNASGTFYLTAPPDFLWNAGNFVIDRVYPTCKCPQDHNRWDVHFQIDKAKYDYSFAEGTPNNYPHSSSEKQNAILGEATKQENTLFAEEDKNRKFSLVVRVRRVPISHNGKRTESIMREPLK